MDSFPIYGQLSIDYGQLSIVWTLSIWTLSMHGQKTVHAWTAKILSIMDTVHTMDNLFLVHVHVHYLAQPRGLLTKAGLPVVCAKLTLSKMEHLKEYLESSTIHGLYYISTCQSKTAKAGWLLIVILGFGCAGYLIQSSFSDWADSPVTTTITPAHFRNSQIKKIYL